MKTYKIETDNVVTTLAGVELDSKASRISCQIMKLSAQINGRVTKEDRGFETNTTQELRRVASASVMRI
jgi:hypothetical protein